MAPLDSLVVAGLTSKPKTLPPVLFYDDEGSALFDAITRTPEYYLTRTERAIFEANAAEILRRANGRGPLSVVELGAGSADKTRILLRRLLQHQSAATYVPIDVSAAPIMAAAGPLEREIPGLRVQPLVGDNTRMLAKLPADGPARLILFIGSSIGNYEPAEASRFLGTIAATLRPQDRVLLGTDLAKEKATLDAAYNDAEGVTARFNLNVLARLNRDYGADADLDAFAHHAFYNEAQGRVEMHLVSAREQILTIPKLDLAVPFAQGETIHTENSYKYTPAGVETLVRNGGLAIDRTWTDPAGWFGVHLLRSEGP